MQPREGFFRQAAVYGAPAFEPARWAQDPFEAGRPDEVRVTYVPAMPADYVIGGLVKLIPVFRQYARDRAAEGVPLDPNEVSAFVWLEGLVLEAGRVR